MSCDLWAFYDVVFHCFYDVHAYFKLSASIPLLCLLSFATARNEVDFTTNLYQLEKYSANGKHHF